MKYMQFEKTCENCRYEVIGYEYHSNYEDRYQCSQAYCKAPAGVRNIRYTYATLRQARGMDHLCGKHSVWWKPELSYVIKKFLGLAP